MSKELRQTISAAAVLFVLIWLYLWWRSATDVSHADILNSVHTESDSIRNEVKAEGLQTRQHMTAESEATRRQVETCSAGLAATVDALSMRLDGMDKTLTRLEGKLDLILRLANEPVVNRQ